MITSSLVHHGSLAIDLNGSSSLLHWSFIDISVANLIVIAVMVVIFGAALVIRFPHRAGADSLPDEQSSDAAMAAAAADQGDAGMWTAKVRTKAAQLLPPKKLLPDRQPAYVSSWIYVFGVASLVALGIVIVSGFGLALGGSDWWHTNADRPLLQQRAPVVGGAVHGVPGHSPVGQVLDGGVARPPGDDVDHRRARVRCLGRHGVHGLPVAGELRLAVDRDERQGRVQRGRHRLDLERDELRPDVHVAHRADAAGAGRDHRARTSCWSGCAGSATRCRRRPVGGGRSARRRPPPTPGRGAARTAATTSSRKAAVATLVVGALTLVMAGVLSSPDVPPVTMQTWGKVAPCRPRLHGRDRAERHLGHRRRPTARRTTTAPRRPAGRPRELAEARRDHPADDAARVFVIGPLSSLAKTTPALATALATYNAATPAQQNKWATAYVNATAPRREEGAVPRREPDPACRRPGAR